MDRLGFVGLGNMGAGMALRLLAAGFDVLGFDTDSSRLDDLSSKGLDTAGALIDISTNCSTVILCLPNPDSSEEVLNSLIEKNAAATIIETSTLTPEIVLKFSERLANAGIGFLSAPMIGGKNHAANGEVEFLVEGDQKLFANTQKIFAAMGQTLYMGQSPSGTLAKISFNLCRYANLATAVEVSRLLDKCGANKAAIYDFMSKQSLDNFGQVWAEDMRSTMLDNQPYQPSQVPAKDLSMFAEMAASKDLDNELIQAIRNTYLSME